MSLLPHKGLLAVTAVLDVALHTDDQPVASRALARRHLLPPRHLTEMMRRSAACFVSMLLPAL